jgi:DNA-binding transcriptional MerR regulator
MGDEHRGWTTGQAARISGVHARTVEYWDISGFLHPSLQGAAGKGSQRRYSLEDLLALKVAGQLRAIGISLQALRLVIARLRARGLTAPLHDVFLVGDGHDVYEVSSAQISSLLQRPGQGAFAWLVNVGTVVTELQEAIAA